MTKWLSRLLATTSCVALASYPAAAVNLNQFPIATQLSATDIVPLYQNDLTQTTLSNIATFVLTNGTLPLVLNAPNSISGRLQAMGTWPTPNGFRAADTALILGSTPATVATTGSYSDLLNKPTSFPPSGSAGGDVTGTFPSNLVVSKIGGMTPAKVATSGAYGDLSGTPTSLPPSGAANGDLSGSFPNPTVSKIGGQTVPTGIAKGNGTSFSTATHGATGDYLAPSDPVDANTVLGKPLSQIVPSLASIISGNLTYQVPGSFATIQAALTALQLQVIPNGTTVTLNVTGRFSSSTSVAPHTPYGRQIFIVGQAPISQAISSETVSGSAGNYSVTYQIPSTAGIQVGDLVRVRGATPSTSVPYGELHDGAWPVTAIGAGTITVQNTSFNFAPPTGVTATLDVFPTQFSFNGISGFDGDNLGGVSNVAVSGTNMISGFGFWDSDQSSLPGKMTLGPNVLAFGFTAGFRANYGGQIVGTDLWSSGSLNNGFEARDSGHIVCTNCVASGNGTTVVPAGDNGWLSQDTSSMLLYCPAAYGNNDAGLFARVASDILVDNSCPGYAVGNLENYKADSIGFFQNENGKSYGPATHHIHATANSVMLVTGNTISGGGVDAFRAESNSIVTADTSAVDTAGLSAPYVISGIAYDALTGGQVSSNAVTGTATTNGWTPFTPTVTCATGSGTFSIPTARYVWQSDKKTCFTVELINTASSSCGYPYFAPPLKNHNKFASTGADITAGTSVPAITSVAPGNVSLKVASVPANEDYVINGCYESQ